MVLAMDSKLTNWSREEKRQAAEILRAKSRGQEADYLRKMQKHASLRALLIKFGSGQPFLKRGQLEGPVKIPV